MKSLLILSLLATFALPVATSSASSSQSYMSDKTEVSINLEVSGAEAVCQTADGYVWIAQYSGLTRYDSKQYVTYKSFTENGKEYSIINVRALATKDNTLYIATYKNIFIYKDYQFSYVDVDAGTIKDIVLDETNNLLYISSSDNGATVYDFNNNSAKKLPGLESGNVNNIALDVARNSYYYYLDDGLFDGDGNELLNYTSADGVYVYDLYSYGDILYIGENTGTIHRYDMAKKSFLDDIVIPDQINKMLYSEKENILFVACENKGLYCVNLSSDTPAISLAGNLTNKSQLVDLMIDYQGNLWIASHFVGASGLSIITKNALSELLYDDEIWKNLAGENRGIYSVEKCGDILYILVPKNIYLYDLKQGKILTNNAIMDAINAYVTEKGITNFVPRDIEYHKNKIYFAVEYVGLVEYDLTTESITIYDIDYINSHNTYVVPKIFEDDKEHSPNNRLRSLRSFDNYLAIGYNRGVMKFDGTNFSIMYVDSNVLYINKTNDGKMFFNKTGGIFEANDDFSSLIELPTNDDATGNILKTLVDGDCIYYTKNSRLFRMQKVDGKYVSKEVIIPYAKGSLVELSKIEYVDINGNNIYKYVIASQTQIYITDSLDVDQITDYEFYDENNGLRTIAANTSGYYDKETQSYYFQSTDGIFVYHFNETKASIVPVKIGVSSIVLDGEEHFGNIINIKKSVYRVTINLSVLGFKPNKGYSIYYKMDGIDKDYHLMGGDDYSVNFTNLAGGNYRFHAYAVDEFGQASNEIDIQLIKEKKLYEYVWFWIVAGILAIGAVAGIAFLIIRQKTRQAIKKQLEYKNITVESIQAIARTIDAKDEYTNGHSTRVGYYSRLIAENLGLSEEEVDNIYYIALLHDIGKIAIPDKILNKPGRLTDEEFAVMKSHTVRGAKILKGISTIPHIIEGAKSHHEKWDGSGYPDGLKGEEIPYVARIICCADCFDAMATKRVYKEPVAIEDIAKEFKRCEGTHFDPEIAEVVVRMMNTGILKPYTAENVYYLGDDGKTHRVEKNTGKNDQ